MRTNFRSSIVTIPSLVLSNFLKASLTILLRDSDMKGCFERKIENFDPKSMLDDCLTRIPSKNSVMLIVPLPSVSNWLKISWASAFSTCRPLSASPLVNSSKSRFLSPLSSILRKHLPSPMIPVAPLARHKWRSFSTESSTRPEASARRLEFIKSVSCRDMAETGRFAISKLKNKGRWINHQLVVRTAIVQIPCFYCVLIAIKLSHLP